METSKPLLKDAEAEDVDVHLYRSMIISLMCLRSSRPDIMFDVCACAGFQVTPNVSHLHVVKRIFRYLKGQPKLGLWYPKDSPFDLEAYSDSDYAGASLDRKSTIGENGNSFNPAAQTTTNADGSSTTLISGPALEDCKSVGYPWNKPNLDTMSFDDLYNNFKLVEQKVKGTTSQGSSSSSQNLGFMSSTSSTNEVNSAYGVSTANTQVSTASTQDLEQIHEDDLEEIDLKWQLALLSMRIRKFFQKIGRKITINGSDTAGYEKSKVECFNCHKLGHFARECRRPSNQDNRSRNQDSSRRTINVEEISSKVMLSIDGAGFDWSFMADEEVLTNMALMDFLDSKVHNDKTCSKTCLKSFETLKTQLDDLRIEFNKSEFNLATYKSGLASVEEQLVFYKKNEVLFCEELAILKRDISYKDSEISVLKRYGPKTSKSVSEGTSNEVRESPDASLVEELVSKWGYKIVIENSIFPTVAKINFVRPQQQEKLVRKLFTYVEMYMSQTPRGNQRNWNNQKSQQLGSDFVMYNKACFVCGSFNHVQANCNYHQMERMVSRNNYTMVNYNYSAKKAHPSAHRNIVPRAVLIKTGLRPLNTARPVNTAHPKTIVYSARPMSCFSKSAQSTGHPQKEYQGYVDSGCSRYMTGNMSYLSDFKKSDEGYVTFGGGAKGERITGKRTLKTGKFDFEDVLHKVPRKNNMYSVDMKNMVPKESLTCLVAKATFDESMIWHRRLGHINFKTINKLVKDNLVKGLPIKHFENYQSYVACLKGKQHKAT
ncbi:ribonuclease H-like domain-containing protein, partial [Tanacetum coccineum]